MHNYAIYRDNFTEGTNLKRFVLYSGLMVAGLYGSVSWSTAFMLSCWVYPIVSIYNFSSEPNKKNFDNIISKENFISIALPIIFWGSLDNISFAAMPLCAAYQLYKTYNDTFKLFFLPKDETRICNPIAKVSANVLNELQDRTTEILNPYVKKVKEMFGLNEELQ